MTENDYLIAWGLYAFAALGCLLVWCRMTRFMWRWLRERALSPNAPQPPLWIGYGESDRFVASNRLIAATLPPEHVLVTDGGHTWAPWQRLWGEFLDRHPFHTPGANS